MLPIRGWRICRRAWQGRLRIGAYGRFCEQKGFDLLIAAHRAGAMPGCDLVLGGFGPDEAALRALAGAILPSALRAGGGCGGLSGRGGRGGGALALGSLAWWPMRRARRAARCWWPGGWPARTGGGAAGGDFADHGALRLAVETLDGEALAAMAAAGALPPAIAPGSARAPGRVCWPTCWGAAPRAPWPTPRHAMPRATKTNDSLRRMV
jgi:hypothetical protein